MAGSMAAVRSVFRLLAFSVWTAGIVAMQCLCLLLRFPDRLAVPRCWHRGVLRVIGVRRQIQGTISKARPTLYVSNHISYLDILVLGSLLKARFVSKREVAAWPVFGFLARIGQTVFIERNPRLAQAQQAGLAEIMAEKCSLILFPEGTSSSGDRVLPFKSTLFSVATVLQEQGTHVMVQPVSIAYTRLDGIPLRRVMRPLVGWYGDMGMGSHLWRVLGLGQLTATIIFHPPVPLERFKSRKEASLYCQQQVAEGLKSSYTGRPCSIIPSGPHD
jgi:lyso-ornithine lipid O-acyltransferase